MKSDFEMMSYDEAYEQKLFDLIKDLETGLRFYIREYKKYKFLAETYSEMYEHSVDERLKLMGVTDSAKGDIK